MYQPPAGTTFSVVGVPGNKVNVIDSTGQRILDEDVDYAFLAANDLIAIDTGSGRYAVFTTKLKQITDYNCKYINSTANPEYIIAKYKRNNADSELYDQLIRQDGKIIFTGKADIIPIDDQLLIANDSIQGGLYTYSGQSVARFPGSSNK
jgi:hypothetical protein